MHDNGLCSTCASDDMQVSIWNWTLLCTNVLVSIIMTTLSLYLSTFIYKKLYIYTNILNIVIIEYFKFNKLLLAAYLVVIPCLYLIVYCIFYVLT